jgi:hypothetical protein
MNCQEPAVSGRSPPGGLSPAIFTSILGSQQRASLSQPPLEVGVNSSLSRKPDAVKPPSCNSVEADPGVMNRKQPIVSAFSRGDRIYIERYMPIKPRTERPDRVIYLRAFSAIITAVPVTGANQKQERSCKELCSHCSSSLFLLAIH